VGRRLPNSGGRLAGKKVSQMIHEGKIPGRKIRGCKSYPEAVMLEFCKECKGVIRNNKCVKCGKEKE
jgi:hypothetical protein